MELTVKKEALRSEAKDSVMESEKRMLKKRFFRKEGV